MLQNDEIRNVILEKSSNAISKAGFILIADTPNINHLFVIISNLYRKSGK